MKKGRWEIEKKRYPNTWEGKKAWEMYCVVLPDYSKAQGLTIP